MSALSNLHGISVQVKAGRSIPARLLWALLGPLLSRNGAASSLGGPRTSPSERRKAIMRITKRMGRASCFWDSPCATANLNNRSEGLSRISNYRRKKYSNQNTHQTPAFLKSFRTKLKVAASIPRRTMSSRIRRERTKSNLQIWNRIVDRPLVPKSTPSSPKGLCDLSETRTTRQKSSKRSSKSSRLNSQTQ